MKKYYIGLDVGTSSVGWAVTNEDYDLLRLKGKHAWGSRIFSEASSKKDRRQFRSSRRRVARRKYRIKLLNQIFAQSINEVDSTFFARLDNASYLFEDKKEKGLSRNLLFKTKSEEISYYNNFPTTWHLRKALINNDEVAFSDIRNIYIALHHIIKYRGNFLKEGTFNIGEFDSASIDRLNKHFKEKYYSNNIGLEKEVDFILKDKATDLIEILLDNNKTKTNKQKEIKKLFNIVDFVEHINMFSSIVTGGTYKLSKIDKSFDKEIDFTKASFEENVSEIQQYLSDDYLIVSIAKEIFDYVALNKLIGNEKHLSDVMIKIYENHKLELNHLKKVIIDIDKNKGFDDKDKRVYFEVFKNYNNDKNYSSFIHKNTLKDRTEIDTFNKYIESVLKENQPYISDELINTYNELLAKAQNKSLLNTISLSSTSLIPHQLHLIELEKIIDNCKEKYPFIYENKNKLIALFKFRVPYYYGPLDNRSAFSNVERKSKDIITPWNINEVVDDNKTRQKFMRKLTNTCSYLFAESVVPKVSLVFEEYQILDRLNVMLVNGCPLSSTEKKEVLNYLLSRSKTTIDQLKKQLSIIKNTPKNDILLSKIKEDIPFEASSHAHLSKKFDISDKQKMEYYVFLATVYADDKKSLKETLKDAYPELKDDEIKHLLTLPTKKWAPISHKLLTGIMYTDDVGVVHSILDLMRETNENFQMIINNDLYGFLNKIKEINDSYIGCKSVDSQVEEILDSIPSIARRSVHQTLLIIDDIIKASFGNIPSKIFVEVTRNEDDKKKGKETNSREKEINDFIQALIKDNESQLFLNAKELNSDFETLPKEKLKSKHIYLYFKQMGIDVYTGKPIDLNDVLSSTKYDLDHIIPQSLIKDDSLDNLVLVDKEYNQRIKKDYYPIPTQIRNSKMISLWKYLRKINAISEKKYNNLIRTSEISLAELEDFVARQINVVDYSNIAIKNILNIKYPNTKVVFSKSQYPHYIRKELNIVKNRNVNDAHHAVDAYLNIISGNILSTEFSNVKKIYEQKLLNNESKTFNMTNTINRYLNTGFNGKLLKEKILRNCFRRDILVTFKNDYENGAFYKQTIYKHSESNSLIPIHTNENNPMHNTSKYGGYSSLKQSYMVAVSYKENNKDKKAILRVPTIYDKVYGNNQKILLQKVVGENATDVKLITKIYQNQKIRYLGCEYLINTSNEFSNKYKMAYQNYIDNSILMYLSKAQKYVNDLDVHADEIAFAQNRSEEKFVISKEKNKDILTKLANIAKKEVYDSCNYIVKARSIDFEIFNKMNLKEQLETISSYIQMFSRNCESIKFSNKFDSMSKNLKMLLSNSTTNFSIIYESPTGLFMHEVKI